jgi:ketol-acid reductoisomerase
MEDCMVDDILTKMLQCMKWWLMDEIFEKGSHIMDEKLWNTSQHTFFLIKKRVMNKKLPKKLRNELKVLKKF